jgi:hypothetical protein
LDTAEHERAERYQREQAVLISAPAIFLRAAIDRRSDGEVLCDEEHSAKAGAGFVAAPAVDEAVDRLVRLAPRAILLGYADTHRRVRANCIRGVWKVTELAWSTPDAAWEIRTPYVRQYIFTEKHYSYMYVPGPGPRKLFAGDPNRPTDAEKVDTYNSVVASTGTYTVSGRTLVLTARVHKHPNEMAGKPLTYSIEFDGSTTLRMVISNPPFLPGRDSRTVLSRIE